MPSAAFTMSVGLCAAHIVLAADLSVPLRIDRWRVLPGRSTIEEAAQDSGTRAETSGLRFWSAGAVAKPRATTWATDLDGAELSSCRYLIFEYRAQWLTSSEKLLALADASGTESPLLEGTDIVPDGRWHRLIARRALPARAGELRLTVSSQDSRAYVAVRRLMLTGSEASFGAALEASAGNHHDARFRTIDLGGSYADSYSSMISRLLGGAENAEVMDGGDYFRKEQVSIEGVPFHVRPDGKNLMSPPPPPSANDEWIENFGMKVRRGRVAPVSRDSTNTVAVGGPASEVYLLLAAELPGKRKFFNAPDAAKAFEDVEEFGLELVYESGLRDLVFPYSISDRRHIVQRALGAYVIPASGEPLASVVVHNRSLHGTVHIAAVTVNTGAKRLFPQLASLPSRAVPHFIEPTAREPFATRAGDLLRLGNRYLDLEIDAANAFSIVKLRSRLLAEKDQTIAPHPGLEILVKGAPLKLVLSDIQAMPDGFDVTYTTEKAAALEVRASVSVGAKPEARFLLTVTNHSGAPRRADIRFPKVSGLNIGPVGSLSYFFPKYRNRVGSQPATFYTQSGFAFPMQFLDVFNSQAGGVYLLSKDLTLKAQRYFLAKDDSGCAFHIEYPALYTKLRPEEPYQGTETVLGVHAGDWHAAAKAYRDWVATWYRPYKAQQDSKGWYRQSFWLITELADGLDHDVLKLPPWYDRESRRLVLRQTLNEFSRDAGATPDILHFWGWNWGARRFGMYDQQNYEDMGGLPAFRAALDDVQQNLHIPVSLYIDGTLCGTKLPFCQELAPSLAMRAADGSIPNPFGSYRMCHITKKWQQHMAEVYARVYRETGAPILYVDEVGSPNFMCYGSGHGHPVPLNMSEADYAHLKAIREATPENVALYGEYPVTDVASQFWDCNISYQVTRWGEDYLGPYYDAVETDDGTSPAVVDALRFLFPRVVQLNLPLGLQHGSWQPLKHIFFNGEALYDAFWDRFESKGQAFMTKAFLIEKEYRDCFSSDEPETMVPTEAPAIAANRFPGRNRTVWTLYNQAYRTVRGRVLAVDHVAGANYRDVWNGAPLAFRIENGKAVLSLELEPQGIGCVAQIRGKAGN